MNHRLVLRRPPALRLDVRALQPARLAALGAEEVARFVLPYGRERVPLAEWFDVAPAAFQAVDAVLELEGDLARLDGVGAGLSEGVLDVHGDVGDAAGLGMSGGLLHVHGRARELAGCAMSGGRLEIDGDVGDLAASALPGDLDGMRGGTFVVRGNAGARLADRMRRGTLVVFGDAGDFACSRLVAGTVAIGGRCGAHAAWGMRRGSIVFAGAAPEPGPTFVPVHSDAAVFWQLLARDLAAFGPPFADLPARRVARFAGDLAVQGHGELLVPSENL